MKAIVKGLQPEEGTDIGEALTEAAKIVEEGLKPILGSVKATPNPQDCTIVIETETDFLGSELAAKISEFFTGSVVRIEVPEPGFELVPC